VINVDTRHGAEPGYEVLWPLGRPAYENRSPCDRIADLNNKVVGELWDYLFRGDEIFPLLEQALGGRYPGMRFIGYEQFGSTHGDEEHKILAELPDRLKSLKVDAVISGMGC